MSSDQILVVLLVTQFALVMMTLLLARTAFRQRDQARRELDDAHVAQDVAEVAATRYRAAAEAEARAADAARRERDAAVSLLQGRRPG